MHLIPEDMRGIGIQISRLEICRSKQTKSNLIDFLNKKLQQKCDKMLKDNNKDCCVSDFNEKSKSDCSEVPLITESSLAMRKISDTEINNLPLELVKSSESTDIAIPINVQIESTLAAKSKNKKLHNSKVNKNIKIKDLIGKSNKKAIQKQTSQENFFKQVKPNSGRSTKYEIPRIQDIDMSVLIELPADIRNEIFDEYKRNKKQSQVSANTASTVDLINEISHNEENSSIQNCSQVDPDVLSALMKSDLHPDVQRDVQMYCDMKREANRVNLKEIRKEKSDNEQLQEADESSKINNKETAILIVNDTCINKAESISQENTSHVKDLLYKKNDIKPKSTWYQINHVEISHNNIAMDKADTFILQNLSILHNNENVGKHQEMLINLVNHLFTLPLQQVPHNYFIKKKILNRN